MEVQVGAGLVTSDEESSVVLDRRSSKTKSTVNFRENGSNGTVKRESETNRDYVAASDEKSVDAQVPGSLMVESDNSIEENGPNRALMLKSENDDKLSMKIFRDVGVTDKLVQNAEERTGGEGFEAAKMNSKSINEGSNRYSPGSSMRPSNASVVMAMPFDSPHSKATLQTSVYFVEEEGSESTELLERGGASLDYESEKIVKSEEVIQTMTDVKMNQNWSPTEEIQEHNLIDLETSTGAFITESFVTSKSNHSEKRDRGKNVCLDTHAFSDTGSTVTVRNGDSRINKEEEKAGNGGFRQHQHGHSISESATQNSHNSALNEQDERQLKENWTRILENTEFEGKVEAIVQILKEQQSYDLICPFCDSCITEHVILRRRDDVKAIESEAKHDTENQNDQAETLNEDSEDIEAYGCLACFSLFFRRGREKTDFAVPVSSTLLQERREIAENEKDTFSCLPFRYLWGQRTKIESEKVAVQESKSTNASQSTSSPAMTVRTTTSETITTTEKIQMGTNAMEIQKAKNSVMSVEIRQKPPEEIGASTNKDGIPQHLGPQNQVPNNSSTALGDRELTTPEKEPENLEENVAPRQGESSSEDEQLEEPLLRKVAVQESASTIASQSTSSPAMTVQTTKSETITTTEKNEFQSSVKKGISGSLEDKIRPDMGNNKVPNESAPVNQWKKKPSYHSYQEDGIRQHLGPQNQVPNNSSTALGNGELSAQKEPENLCGCIPAVLSIWSTKKIPTDERQLAEPLLRKDDFEETRDPASLAQSKVDDSFSPSSEISQNAGKIVLSSHAAVETVLVVESTSDPQPSNSATVASEFGNTSSQLQDSSVATEWDLLKSIVYGGLTVSITSLGVVSSAAGGDAKTLTVIAIGLAHLVSGLFLIFNNILHLSYQERVETVGHRFWFNGFVAILSYLVFGSLAPLTYGFSFQKSDDILYKFLAASIVSLVSIILLALGKAAVTTKNYIRVVMLYIVTGVWASIIGFFAGEYIKKLLEKWGFVTD